MAPPPPFRLSGDKQGNGANQAERRGEGGLKCADSCARSLVTDCGTSQHGSTSERDYTYPALRLIQVLPGHPLADPKDETVSSIQRRTSL